MSLFQKLIEDLSAKTGLDLKLDAYDACSLENNGLFVTIQYKREQDEIVLFAPVTDPDEISELSEEMLRTALTLSFNGLGTNGYFLGLFDDSLLLSTSIPCSRDLDVETFAEKIVHFTDSALKVRDDLLKSADDFKDANESFLIPHD
ncbi:MAG: type III secretion system chaperone [Succinivibrio sp.]|nr:type III secretion system chaperone [Succinivibrio sp.]